MGYYGPGAPGTAESPGAEVVMLVSVSRLVTESLADRVYRVLREEITHGRLAQGERLDVTAISETMGVSKTPLREALGRLETDQLVITRPRSGTFVARITAEDIAEMCGMRKAIEWFATFEATHRMPDRVKLELREEIEQADRAMADGDYQPFFTSDMNLHRTIIEHAGNTRMIAVRDSIEAYVEWLRIAGATGIGRTGGAAARHHEIITAMIDGDAEKAQQAAVVHIDEVRDWTLEDFHAMRQSVAT
ncbi:MULTISPECIES: GntR family transcriptional regulator [Pseudonocardia]|uniref:GntR family transcriptional regulator n=2 Tax=Pseudonocardia TaxID=1847 RepID=A0ABQ0S133_9PSEU|nr:MULTISPECIES: GntR family transcriptional regulator [Pseudonocardia]OSY36246.1 putative HTH-type transcriptional regulator YdfH [Pseudonocardia autotrophica]TDN73054.1 GntR family transcriptional regulator [Pseudonocardia autotrophica]BBG03772.1 GntR family transcriptional regulator [Pseudonocardia autotrophica]GEC26620.1 GntR family transcriptional regulator [Pseudonocardia saturnea]